MVIQTRPSGRTKNILPPECSAFLKTARESANLSINEVSRLTDLSPTYVWMLEKGERGATIGTLNTLADALKVQRYTLLTKAKKIDPDQLPSEYRETVKWLVNTGADFWDSKLPRQVTAHLPSSLFNPNHTELSKEAMELKVERILTHISEDLSIEIKPPVPLEVIARLGFFFDVCYDPNLKERGSIHYPEKKIYINSSRAYSPEQQRFTLGHELGHYFLSVYDNFIFEPKSAGLSHLRERQADLFSAVLLMPRRLIKSYLHQFPASDPTARAKLAHLFAVSTTAMELRLLQLGIVSRSKIELDRRTNPIRMRRSNG